MLALLATGAALANASPIGRILVPATTTVSVSHSVAATGTYRVVVSVHAHRRTQTVAVFVTGASRRTVVVHRAKVMQLHYRIRLDRKRVSVRAVSAPPAVGLGMTVAIQRSTTPVTAPTQSTAPTGSTTPAPTPTPTPPPAPAAPPQAPDPYTHLVWSDEFTGAAGSAPNAQNWNLDTGGGCGNGTLSTNTTSTANASLNGSGQLAITALRNGSGYTSAQLDSNGLQSFEYGSIQASIELPAGQGLCSAFWMVGDSTSTSPCNWPGCGEVDIVEAPSLGAIPETAVYTLHGPISSGATQQFEAYTANRPDLSTGFHTYGIIWSPGSITWTIDGVAMATATPATLVPGSSWVYDGRKFHIILDLAVGGWPGAPPAATQFPAKMLVDWVRAYD